MQADDHHSESRLRRIFLEALEKTSPAEQDLYLEAACEGDAGLRSQMDTILSNHQDDSFLQRPAVDILDEEASPRRSQLSTTEVRIGRYTILESIGVGGMGEVFRAEQHEPIRREVALKIIKLGMDTEGVIARFEAERQALALMEHPNIARVFDAGATETGRPYFVMELVQGIPITKHCDKNRLVLRDRLGLFIQVCRAVQHAHGKGIIHRDIKPSNILVAVNDNAPVPMIIDFGIAKATAQQRLTDKTLLTGITQFVGTPTYMSPEQASMADGGIDTRSDIYALGVLLYELLLSRPPIDASELTTAGLDGMRRMIREQVPPRPSACLRAMPEGDQQATAHIRGSEPARLIRLLRGDLDVITMKALEKDPVRRYETAHAMAEDIERCLGNVPILARPPRIGYLVRKFVRRHRTRLATASVVCALLYGLVTLAWDLRRRLKAEELRWASGEALSELVELIEQEDYEKAFPLAREIQRVIPANTAFSELWPLVHQRYTVVTVPPRAEISCQDIAVTNAPWQQLGRAPLKNIVLPRGPHRLRIAKAGYAPHVCVVDYSLTTEQVYETRLQPVGPADEMVWIHPFSVPLSPSPSGESVAADAPPFLLDRTEVSNKDYALFVNSGGYTNPAYWQELVFHREGRAATWAEAMDRFRDQTGRPGPSTWRDGSYPLDQDNYPVSGISWYEAMAYAAFSGKQLPTLHHWRHAACLGESLVITPFSNFSDRFAPVGSHPGMGHTGLHDMAGNVKEWCVNATDNTRTLRYILGGARGEPTYLFTLYDAQSPWSRSSLNGFRCASFPDDRGSVSTKLFEPVPLPPSRDLAGLVPFSDDEFHTTLAFYDYDRTPLNARVEDRLEASPFWDEEVISFDAAYAGGRVVAHLFLPKAGTPPYQAVLYVPGKNAVSTDVFHGPPLCSLATHIVGQGRAMIFPIYYGTYERPAARGRSWDVSDVVETPLAYRDWTVKIVQDVARSLDYLETREDIDSEHMAYYGYSMGSILGTIMLAVEDRFEAGILVHGGVPPITFPRSFDIALYAQRVTSPVLMINGREDVLAPLETSQQPLLQLLQTRNAHVEHRLYAGGHGTLSMFYSQIRSDVLRWLDRYLGPVTTTPGRPSSGE